MPIILKKHYGIGVTGERGSGKDLFSDFLTGYFCPFPVCRISTGSLVRKDIEETLGTDPVKLNTLKNVDIVRRLQQDWAMKRREENPAYWIEKGEEIIKTLKQPHILVFSSMRMLNEATYIRQQFGGVVVKIERAVIESYSKHVTKIITTDDTHITETELHQIQWDFMARNHGSPKYLCMEAKRISEYIKEIIERTHV